MNGKRPSRRGLPKGREWRCSLCHRYIAVTHLLRHLEAHERQAIIDKASIGRERARDTARLPPRPRPTRGRIMTGLRTSQHAQDGSLFSAPTWERSPCFAMCGKAVCRRHGCLHVYEAQCEDDERCTCPEAGLDPGCKHHGSSAGGEGYA